MIDRGTQPRPVAITMGDACGIGPEIIAKLAADRSRSPVPIVVIGDAGALRRGIALVGADLEVHLVASPRDLPTPRTGPSMLPVIEAGLALPDDLAYGRVDARAGAAAVAYLEHGIDLAMAGEVSAIVTAPLNKEAMRAAGIPFPGHTEILAARSGTEHVTMMLANDELRVVLVSIHLALAEAVLAVTFENVLRTIRLADAACRSFGIAQPRVAIAGLNPHAGEHGLFGREEIVVIEPAIAAARAAGIDASGPWAGDTVFMRARRGEFDIVVAQYHDQGLIPVKYLGIDHGVNVTLGLPFVRTSVDHGTAFDIAGTGQASHASLAYALEQAVRFSPEPVAGLMTESAVRRYERTSDASAKLFRGRPMADANGTDDGDR